MKWLGLVALVGTAIHCGYHLYHHRPWDLLWACHVAAGLIGIGCVIEWPSIVGVGVLWLIVGLPMWILYLATGGEFTPTSLLTHVLGLAIGIAFVVARGMPAGVWWQAILGMIALQLMTRWTTPATENVNLAFSVHRGWEGWFRSYAWYWATLTVVFAITFVASEWLLRLIFGETPRGGSTLD